MNQKWKKKLTDVAKAKNGDKLLALRTNEIHNICTSKLIKIKIGGKF